MACWTSDINCCDNVPLSSSRCPPRAVSLPNRTPSRIECRTLAREPLACLEETPKISSMVQQRLQMFHVMPDGPPTAPLLADLKLQANRNSSIEFDQALDTPTLVEENVVMEASSGSRNALRVASDPGANNAPSKLVWLMTTLPCAREIQHGELGAQCPVPDFMTQTLSSNSSTKFTSSKLVKAPLKMAPLEDPWR